MNRRKLLTVTAVIGIFAGALGFGAVGTQALAAVGPGHAVPIAGPAQAAPAPTGTCPFLHADGTRNFEAMHEYMDTIHGEGWFEQMWGWMNGNGDGVTPGTGTGTDTGYGPGTGICPFGIGTGPGTGVAPEDGTGYQYGPARRAGMMGAGFGFGVTR
jgi:hypothetical protein